MNKTTARSAEGFIDPGGSSPLAVLGHVEAAMELARQIARRSCAMDGPPDYVFLPIGTGGTAMGLVLGFYLLGWPTRVVATCSQDKSLLAKLVVNGDIIEPFDIAHAKHLLAESMPWVHKLGLVGDNVTAGGYPEGQVSSTTTRPGTPPMARCPQGRRGGADGQGARAYPGRDIFGQGVPYNDPVCAKRLAEKPTGAVLEHLPALSI